MHELYDLSKKLYVKVVALAQKYVEEKDYGICPDFRVEDVATNGRLTLALVDGCGHIIQRRDIATSEGKAMADIKREMPGMIDIWHASKQLDAIDFLLPAGEMLIGNPCTGKDGRYWWTNKKSMVYLFNNLKKKPLILHGKAIEIFNAR
jgi:hypothetical protein